MPMINEALTPREARGIELAETGRVRRKRSGMGQVFTVPSQSNENASYTVIRRRDDFMCSCPDYEERGTTCKHGFAVQYFRRRRVTRIDGVVMEETVRVTYAQNWPAYNQAQTTEKAEFCTLLRDLVSSVPSPEQKRGRPSLPLSDMIFSAAFKVYSTVSARRFMTDLRTATSLGMIDRTPHYNSIFNCLDKESLTPILHELITRAALPLRGMETDFAVDSTGFGLQNFYRHFSAKYGRDVERREFLKLHAMVGTKTNVVTAVAIDSGADTTMLAPLVTATASQFDVQRVTADKAYGSRFNRGLIESLGAEVLIPFKTNTVSNPNSPMWNRLFHYFSFHRDQFLTAYHQRSNVESTFSAIKRKFGDQIRSKSKVAQRNEALLKVLCHNIVCVIHEIHESGAAASFPALVSCPKISAPAQQTFELEG
jgi:transposase